MIFIDLPIKPPRCQDYKGGAPCLTDKFNQSRNKRMASPAPHKCSLIGLHPQSSLGLALIVFNFFSIFSVYFVCVWDMSLHLCGSQKTVYRSPLSPSMWVPGIEQLR